MDALITAVQLVAAGVPAIAISVAGIFAIRRGAGLWKTFKMWLSGVIDALSGIGMNESYPDAMANVYRKQIAEGSRMSNVHRRAKRSAGSAGYQTGYRELSQRQNHLATIA
jgi:hypothetical protein